MVVAMTAVMVAAVTMASEEEEEEVQTSVSVNKCVYVECRKSSTQKVVG